MELELLQGHIPAPETTSWAPRACDATGGILDDIPPGEQVQALFLGQLPSPADRKQMSVEFPAGMATDAMFPEVSSEYTFPDGTKYTVPCYIPGVEAKVGDIVCPDPFVSNAAGSDCVQPCPVSAYTDKEYTFMWASGSAVATVGFSLNLFMAFTWLVGGRRHLSGIRPQLRNCVIGGVLYGMVRFSSCDLSYFNVRLSMSCAD